MLYDESSEPIDDLTWTINGLSLETMTVTSSDIDTFNDRINATDHPFSQGDQVTYINDSVAIGGLTSGDDYFVISTTKNTFELSETSDGTVLDLTSAGTGSNTFTESVPSYTTGADVDDVVNMVNINHSLSSAIDRLINYSAIFDEAESRIYITAENGANTSISYDFDLAVTPDTSTDIFTTATNHPFSDDDLVRFSTTDDDPPTGLTNGHLYYVKAVTDATTNQNSTTEFKITETIDGPTVDITGLGTGTHSFAPATLFITDITIPIGVSEMEVQVDGGPWTSVYVDIDTTPANIIATLAAAGLDATVTRDPTVDTIELPENIVPDTLTIELTASIHVESNEIEYESHGFSNDDTIDYSFSDNAIDPLTEKTYYIVESTTDTFKLSETEGGAAISLESTGLGTHTFTKTDGPTVTIESDGISTADDFIEIIGHKLSDGEQVRYLYQGDDAAIAELTSGSDYFVVSSTDDTFKLAETLGGTALDLTSVGTGTHAFITNEILTVHLDHADNNFDRTYQLNINGQQTRQEIATALAQEISDSDDINEREPIYLAAENNVQLAITSPNTIIKTTVSSTSEDRPDFTGTRQGWLIRITNTSGDFDASHRFTDGLANALSTTNSSTVKVQQRYTEDGYWAIQRELTGDTTIHTLASEPVTNAHYLPQTSATLHNGDHVVYERPLAGPEMRELHSGSHYVVINASGAEFSLSEEGPISFHSPTTGDHTVRTGLSSDTNIQLETGVTDAADSTLYTSDPHGLTNGQQVRYLVDDGAEIPGLTSGQYYYIANSSANSFQLVSSQLSLLPIDLDTLPIQYELTTLGNYSVVDPNTQGADKYIRSFATINEKGPRLIGKEVWDDLDNDGTFERTGEYAFFEDPAYENDSSLDQITINTSANDDYLLIGHEVLNRGEENQETIYSTIQITHQEMVDGVPNPDPNAETVSILIRGIDKAPIDCGTPKENIEDEFECLTAAKDELTINALEGDDRIIAGLIPNSTEIPADYVLSAHVISELGLYGGAGDDRIIGSKYVDLIHLGSGNDTITGNEMGDTFLSDDEGSHEADHLIEARDATTLTTTAEVGGQCIR